ncbi:hypothetical protein I312_105364 [Cryptococcus bacillisporus CA1280]|uniref:Tim44-like domain-containing protein n=1 Tax=Cryptococcus bacillisporus CA1280 TaxID=1296109 RepID=A0A0D0UHV4_CRYGA|nr:hypothetical protein I312_02951 [Cryptococcus bacillisporus CA1280]
MSLLPFIRHSASLSTATRSATLFSLRYASSTTQPKPKSKLTKELELEAEEQRQMLARAARSNPGVDLSAQKLPLFEAQYDAPRSWPEFWHKTKDAEYERDRKDRQDLTNQSISELIGQGGLEEYKNSPIRFYMPSLVRRGFVWLNPAGSISRSIKSLTELYYKYMQVQASGTLGQVLSISKDDAYSAAQNIIRNRKDKLKWQLVKENKSAKLVWARMTVLDPREDKMAAQIVLAFDTQQAVITQKDSAPPTRRTQHVVENIVFEKIFPSRDDWKIKGRLIPSKTPDVQTVTKTPAN